MVSMDLVVSVSAAATAYVGGCSSSCFLAASSPSPPPPPPPSASSLGWWWQKKYSFMQLANDFLALAGGMRALPEEGGQGRGDAAGVDVDCNCCLVEDVWLPELSWVVVGAP